LRALEARKCDVEVTARRIASARLAEKLLSNLNRIRVFHDYITSEMVRSY
jgi:methyl coenzyme M reductase subunit D